MRGICIKQAHTRLPGRCPPPPPKSVCACVCYCWSAAKVCDRQDLSSNNRRFGQPIDPLVTRRLTLSENIVLITVLRHTNTHVKYLHTNMLYNLACIELYRHN